MRWQGVGVNGAGSLGERVDRILQGGLARDISRASKSHRGVCCAAAIFVVVACHGRAASHSLR